jgi:hypothetical protein
MRTDPIRGSTIRWTFNDGPMAGRTFEHRFDEDGSVTWCVLNGTQREDESKEVRYEIANVGDDVYAVSYLGSSGWTLTCVLDFRTDRIVAFASNEKSLIVQQGTFEADDEQLSESSARQ